MPMKDEEYLFISDVREKKRIANSAFNKRTHCGKGGAVKFPSDNLSRKELNAMNGKVESYRMNDPMTYAEFKKMPDDLKISYVKLIRQKFGVSDSQIAKMLGVPQSSFSNEVRSLGIGTGRNSRNGKTGDKEGFWTWVHGLYSPGTVEPVVAPEETKEPEPVVFNPEPEPAVPAPVESVPFILPERGSLTFEGNAQDILKSVGVLMGGANVRVTVAWTVCPEEGACSLGD